jgi:hypothetical protein
MEEKNKQMEMKNKQLDNLAHQYYTEDAAVKQKLRDQVENSKSLEKNEEDMRRSIISSRSISRMSWISC